MNKEVAIPSPRALDLDKPADNETLDDQELGIVPESLERIEQVYR